LPPAERSRENLRKHFGGKKQFSADQRKALIQAIASGYYSGGERIR
jgi:predicted DNA binding protein